MWVLGTRAGLMSLPLGALTFKEWKRSQQRARKGDGNRGRVAQKSWRTEVSGRETRTAVVSTEEWPTKEGAHLGYLATDDLQKSSQEGGKLQQAEQWLANEKEALRWLEEEWALCLKLFLLNWEEDERTRVCCVPSSSPAAVLGAPLTISCLFSSLAGMGSGGAFPFLVPQCLLRCPHWGTIRVLWVLWLNPCNSPVWQVLLSPFYRF